MLVTKILWASHLSDPGGAHPASFSHFFFAARYYFYAPPPPHPPPLRSKPGSATASEN